VAHGRLHEQDDRRFAGDVAADELIEELGRVHVPRALVAEHQVEGILPDQLQGLFARVDRFHRHRIVGRDQLLVVARLFVVRGQNQHVRKRAKQRGRFRDAGGDGVRDIRAGSRSRRHDRGRRGRDGRAGRGAGQGRHFGEGRRFGGFQEQPVKGLALAREIESQGLGNGRQECAQLRRVCRPGGGVELQGPVQDAEKSRGEAPLADARRRG